MFSLLRDKKGITLIALVVTIIILLILAGVSIVMLSGDNGILKQATIAKEKTQNASDNEIKIIDNLVNTIENFENEETKLTWKETEKGKFKCSNGTVVNFGDYVAYDEGTAITHNILDPNKGIGTACTRVGTTNQFILTADEEIAPQNLKWRVLGVNKNGQLELISEDPENSSIYIDGEMGYINLSTNLNNYCNELYGKGNYATSARSLNIDDVNNLITDNYNPKSDSINNIEYGTKWKYYYEPSEGSVKYSKLIDDVFWDTWKGTTWGTFKVPGDADSQILKSGQNEGESNARILEYTYYSYTLSDHMDEKVANLVGNGTNVMGGQFLSSSCVKCTPEQAEFSVYILAHGTLSCHNLYYSYEDTRTPSYDVRPVVTLSTNVKLTNEKALHSSEETAWLLSPAD